MKTLPAYKWIIRALIALCFAAQSYSLSHATSFGDAPHNHDGIECEITLVTANEDVSLPTPTLENKVEGYTVATPYKRTIQRPYLAFSSRAPPPRGPPTLF